MLSVALSLLGTPYAQIKYGNKLKWMSENYLVCVIILHLSEFSYRISDSHFSDKPHGGHWCDFQAPFALEAVALFSALALMQLAEVSYLS